MNAINKTHYRQGDVLVTSIPALPKSLKPVARQGGRLILAAGKSTGHHHAIATKNCDLFTAKTEPGALILSVKAVKADLVHDEHSAIQLPKGNYRVTRQREFSAAAVRRVED
jgi:hypothetical protein